MVFSSILFMFIYLPVVLAVYYIVPLKWRNPWLFVVNLVFYGWGEPVYILLMLFSIIINYISGIYVGKYREDNIKKAKSVLVFNIIINLAMLMFFKYYDLFANTLRLIPGLEFIQPLGIALPIGISFYTFQTMSYPIDIYRGDSDVQKNFISFGTFVALFPQLIAGPIIRYKDVASQLGFRASSAEQFASGIRRFSIGLAKKVLIANNIGKLWDTYSAMASSDLTFVGSWIGIVAFSLQIYFDFSGYSDMAVGLGRMLGFEFMENFNYPYISHSVTEFWRRWHISLGTWFRDYVYIPLGGNRKGKARQLLNICIVWALTGFWHGANWTFLLWGLYYAVFLIIEKLYLLDALNRAPKFIGHFYTILVAVCGWVLFQLNSLSECGVYYKAMFGLGDGGFVSPVDSYYFTSFAVMFAIAIIACTPLAKNLFDRLPQKAKSFSTPALILLALIVCTGYLVDATYNPFLYFRF
ncbi:MAG: MBOAT family protein [Clostridiales bacterium]|jgi:alginate O-acetyltransferase complex protein AlgI|nr:MBOAT family protein [Clostridiales bacterium]